MAQVRYFDRDISWLSFNQRILEEALKTDVPLLEKINFLAIYTSNLDEFYRVRMPVLSALKKIGQDIEKSQSAKTNIYEEAKQIIQQNQDLYGKILHENIIPELEKNKIHLIYNRPLPEPIVQDTEHHFFSTLSAFLEISYINESSTFFPENNQLYFAVSMEKDGHEDLVIINIPSDRTSRFYTLTKENIQYIIFIDDIIRKNISYVFPDQTITGLYSFKVTRDAELDLENEYEGDLAKKIEEKIKKREFGLATRMLYPPAIPEKLLKKLTKVFNLQESSTMPGGNYHNLKDFFKLPIKNANWKYAEQKPLQLRFRSHSIFSEIHQHDILINTPYESYDTVLRFFNEAAFDRQVEEIHTTIYRAATDSKILQALMTAVKNGKKVTVFVELKARFDEANNIRWAYQMRAAGVKVLYSIPNLKVHAKVALVKRKEQDTYRYYGLLSTGNLNENTAKVYSDHNLLTANQDMLNELSDVFSILSTRKSKNRNTDIHFRHLLVARFNLAQAFLDLIEREIQNAKKGLPASIIIKLNNLEEKAMISKLYEASEAGVKVNLIIRSICRLIPGMKTMSENISIRRIVDRYLEHSRVFIFHNNGDESIYLGSADWMNRNIHHRIEVCFPVYDPVLKQEIKDIINIQLEDDTSAVTLDNNLQNIPLKKEKGIRAQEAIYNYCKRRHTKNH